LRTEIESKLIGERDRRKGPRQLAEAIQRIAAAPRDIVAGLDLSQVVTCFPVLIIRDDLGSAMFVNEYLNERFQQFIVKKVTG
jgi:hypothetical protein